MLARVLLVFIFNTVLLSSAVTTSVTATASSPKLIISILIDDLGFHDLGYTGSRILTPHFDQLRGDGVKLTSFYVQPICTPSRASFLTNRLPLALGLQGKQTVQQGCAWGLDVEEQTFVEALASSGWETHMVGKSHLGADRWRRTPTFRGFSSFWGYYYGAEDYYTHKVGQGYDLRNDTGLNCGPGCSQAIGSAFYGTYSPYLYGPAVIRHIANAGATNTPTYIHFTPQSVHAPNQAPETFVAPYRPIFGPTNPIRAIHAGALACLDEAIGNITAAIAAAGLSDDTLIFVTADNGGPLGATGDGTMASNFPLRGGKHTLYEGGVRAEAFAWGPKWFGEPNNFNLWSGLAHVSDVGLTILDAAGVSPLPPKVGREVHGVSFWSQLVSNTPSNRSYVVANLDYTSDGPSVAEAAASDKEKAAATGEVQNYAQAALVAANGWKLLLGNPATPDRDYWSDENGEPSTPPPPAAVVTRRPSESENLTSHRGGRGGAMWPLGNMTPSLYNVTADPRETHNVASEHPDVVAEMIQVLAEWGQSAVPVIVNKTQDPSSDPDKFWNGSWTPWLGL